MVRGVGVGPQVSALGNSGLEGSGGVCEIVA